MAVCDSKRALFASAIDYAGLFPPAALPMAEAVSNYRRYRQSEGAWMLGSFVAPITRAEELAVRVGAEGWDEALPTSLLLGPQPLQTVDHVEPTRARFEGRLEVGSIEVAPLSAEEIPVLAAALAEDLTVFFELPVDEQLEERLAAVADAGACAKIRTGGVTADAIPSVVEVARFLSECRAREVPFKATAGLHHAVRGPQPLTYEPDSERAWMHGFVNLSIAAALLDEGQVGPEEVVEVLAESSPSVFRLREDRVSWRDRSVDLEQVARSRRRFFPSFGSCSYEEPREELEKYWCGGANATSGSGAHDVRRPVLEGVSV